MLDKASTILWELLFSKERKVETRRAMQCDSAITSLASGSSTVPKFCCTRRTDNWHPINLKGCYYQTRNTTSFNVKTVTHTQEVAKNSVSEAVSHSSDESLTDYCCKFPSSFCQALQASNTTTTKQLVGFCWTGISQVVCSPQGACQPTHRGCRNNIPFRLLIHKTFLNTAVIPPLFHSSSICVFVQVLQGT